MMKLAKRTIAILTVANVGIGWLLLAGAHHPFGLVNLAGAGFGIYLLKLCKEGR